MTALTDEASAAAIELVGRTGATGLEVGWLDNNPAARFYAHAQYRGARITADNHPTPEAALEALTIRLLHGGRCTSCHKIIAMSDAPVPLPQVMLDGDVVDEDTERARGLCRWNREGPHWIPGCGTPAPTGSSREKLAQALIEWDAPSNMIATARTGLRWDDYLSDQDFPIVLLVADLQANGYEELAHRAMNGEFDGTTAESKAWAQSPEGTAAFAELVAGAKRPPKQPRSPRKPSRKGRK